MLNKGLSLSTLFLLGANFLPLLGVLFYGWDLGLVLGLFWIENLIIGLFNLFKMLLVGVRTKAVKAFFLAAFFVLHYGTFCMGHGSLMWEILALGELNYQLMPFNFGDTTGFSGIFVDGIALVFNFIDLYQPAIYLAILALFISHVVRFIESFIVRGGILSETADTLMVRPYGQIIIMHLGLLGGGLLAETLGSPVWLLFALVVFKVAVDVAQLQRRHRKRNTELIKGI